MSGGRRQLRGPLGGVLSAYCGRYLDYLERKVFAGGCFWAAVATEFDDRPGAVRDAVRAGVLGWLGELERQGAIADVEEPAALAFEVYSLGLGANACSRLLDDRGAFARARVTIERRLQASAHLSAMLPGARLAAGAQPSWS